jgi:hypothetical protein
MCQPSLRALITTLLLLVASLITPSRADDQAASRLIQEEIWALPLPIPMFAYLVRPVGDGPFPLVIMNHGVSLNPTDRGFFPLVEFRDAAKWFAKRGYLVLDMVQRPSTSLSMVSTARSSQKSESAATPISALPAWRLHKLISGSSTT